MSGLREQLQSTLGGDYSIERELGGGGMSRVFVARDHTLGRDVVVKVIAPENAEGLSAERFAREVKLAARLQQANIVPVLTAGTAGHLPFYIMPFVRGESLRARLAGGVPLTVVEAVGILRDVARALAYAHADGVVHRDIKPENILLSGGAAVVTDFGIAKAIDESRTHDGGNVTGITHVGTMLGTPAYMAPEQALGDPSTDFRADIYSWGIVAWELLGGAHPFAGRSTMQALISAHVTETPPSLSARRPNVPESLARLVMRCLDKQPANRPASAAELVAALESVNTSGENAAAHAPRHTTRYVIAGAALLATIAVIATVVALRRSPRAADVAAWKSLAVLPFVAAEQRRALELEPTNVAALTTIARGYTVAGMHDSANAVARRMIGVTTAPGRLGLAAFTLARNGERREAEAIIRKLEALPQTTWTRSSGLAIAYLGIGDTARSETYMERAATGDGDLLILLSTSVGGAWPRDARADAVLRRFHLDPALMQVR